MTDAQETTLTALLLGGIAPTRRIRVERLVLQVPALAEGALVSASVAFHPRLGELAIELCLGAAPAALARIRQRLAFWVAREGGSARPTEGMSAEELLRFRGAFRDSELSMRDLRPAQWAATVRRLFAVAGAEEPGDVPEEPELHLHLGGRGWQGFAFDPEALRLDVPCPLAPPAGDALRLVLQGATAPGAPCLARARVVAVRSPVRATVGAPAGFTLALEEGSDEAARLLAARCPARRQGVGTRAAPRYDVTGGAHLDDPGEELRYASEDEFQQDYLANLSHGGAFVRTARPRSIGERVNLHVRMPGGDAIAIPATVVHRTGGGVGLQFELTGPVEQALAAAVAQLAGRPRRLLIVDDDALARQILTDVFTQRGFEVRTATDGEAGLRAITDELLALDAVVTDVQMPGLSGEALVSAVRSAGGEGELAVLVVGATIDPELTARLEAAGADRILSKAAGASAVVDAVEEVLRVRATLIPSAANDGDPFLAAAAPTAAAP